MTDFHRFYRRLRHYTGMRSKNREKSAPNKPIVAFAVEFCIICSSSRSFIRPAMFHSELEWKVGLGGGRGA